MARSTPTAGHNNNKSEPPRNYDHKLMVTFVVVGILLCVIVIMAIYDITKPYRERRDLETANVTAAITALIKTQADIAGQDKSALEQAKLHALQFISAIRLREGHIWVAEANGRFLYFPTNKALVGKPLSALKDQQGKAFYKTLADDAKAQGQVSRDLAVPTNKINTFKNVVLNVGYVKPWDWVVGVTLPELKDQKIVYDMGLRYGLIIIVLLSALIIPMLLLRRKVRRLTYKGRDIFRALAYAQPLPPQAFPRAHDEFGELAKAYDVLLEAEDLRGNSFHKVQDARSHPLITSVIEATLVIDTLANDLLEAGRRISEVDYDQTLFVLDQTLSHVEQAKQSVSKTIDQTRKLNGHINQPLLLIQDRTHENTLAKQADDELNQLSEQLDQIVETLRTAAVRTNIDALGSVWTALKDQKIRNGNPVDNQVLQRLESFSKELRSMTERVDSSIQTLKPKLTASTKAIKGYDNLITMCEADLGKLRKALQVVPENLTTVVERYNTVGEALVKVRDQVAKLRIAPSETSGAGFAHDTLAIAERSQQARLDIERVLRFGKR